MIRRNIARPVFICVHFQVARNGSLGLEALFMVKNDPMNISCSGLRYARGETVNHLFLQDLRITAIACPSGGEAKLILQDAVVYRRRIPTDFWTLLAMARTILKINTGLRIHRKQEDWTDDIFIYLFKVARIVEAKVISIVGERTGLAPVYSEWTEDALRDQFRRLLAEHDAACDAHGVRGPSWRSIPCPPPPPSFGVARKAKKTRAMGRKPLAAWTPAETSNEALRLVQEVGGRRVRRNGWGLGSASTGGPDESDAEAGDQAQDQFILWLNSHGITVTRVRDRWRPR